MVRKKQLCLTTEKKCTDCGEIKALEFFAKLSSGSRGLCGTRNQCVACHKLRVSEQNKKRYQANPTRKRLASRTYYNNNRVAVSERQALKRYSGVTTEMVKARREGACNVCGIPASEAPKKILAIDHDHNTGQVRGLLCQKCNTALGLVGDSQKILKAMIDYLQQGE